MKFTVEISDDDLKHINALIERTNRRDDDANTHGTLSLEILARMLLEDVALAERRPGSWEGSHMTTVLAAHGYDV